MELYMKPIQIVVLGGGYAGVHAAKKLHKQFKKMRDRVEITLIDKDPFHVLMTELHELAGGRVPEESVKISFDRIFAGSMVKVVQDTIVSIDFEGRTLTSSTETYGYDYLLMGTGAESSDFGIPGIKEHAFSLWGLADALKIREHIKDTVRAASYEKDPERRRQMLTFVVAGAGFTGIEMVGELIEWIPVLCKEFKADPDEIQIITVEGLGKILNTWPEKPRMKAEKYLKKKGVEIKLNSFIVKAEPGSITLKDKTVIKSDTVIWTCGIKGSDFAQKLPLAEGMMARKRVNEYMKSVDYDRVYLAGDAVWFIEHELPLPQTVEAAEQTAFTAVDSMVYEIRKELGFSAKEPKPFKSNFHGYMVSIGGRYAVSYTMGIAMSGIFAMGLKHLVNVYYQHTTCGINGWWRYLQHEIFDIKNKRSFIGGLATAKLQSYWLTFLRMYLGVMWFIEGAKKIPQGWLSDTTGGKVYWGSADGTAGATWEANDAEGVSAVTSSTPLENGAEGVSAVTTSTPWENGAEGVTAATDALSMATPGGGEVAQYAPPLLSEPTAIFQWVNETFVAQAPYFFQVSIVLGEIALGLAFLVGLFTFPAAIASIGLSLMLLMGALASQEILWYIAVSIVMLGGAGKCFGLDYWVMPWIKKWWNGCRLAHKTYLYLDEPVVRKKRFRKKG